MFYLIFMVSIFFGGVFVDPFPLFEDASQHHQIQVSAAIAPDGHFGVAWVDSLQLSDHYELNLYVRFFDKNGNSLTGAYKLPKTADTCGTFFPCMQMDSTGYAVLVWIDNRTTGSENLSNIRFQRFGQDGSPVSSAKTLFSQVDIGYPTPISLSNNAEFAMAFSTWLNDSSCIWVQRFNLSGIALNQPFAAHAPFPMDTINSEWPHISLNDSDDIVVTWLDYNMSAHMYPCFQVFDKDDNPIQPWEPKGYRLDDGADRAGACAPKPFWLDNDRFVVFWTDYCAAPSDLPVFGRVFEDRGITRHPITVAFCGDPAWYQGSSPRGEFATAVIRDGRSVCTHTRVHTVDSGYVYFWTHAAGVLGEVKNNEAQPSTGLFEYTAPWDVDTFKINPMTTPIPVQTPAVSATSDRILWVYSRFTRVGQDSVFKAFAMITDWNMVGVAEPSSPITPSPVTHLEVANPIGSSITLRYSNCPEGFRASVYDASGRKVDELHSSQSEGTIQWGGGRECYGPGVYFIVPQEEKISPSKVVLVR
jgi:hypothetical protein